MTNLNLSIQRSNLVLKTRHLLRRCLKLSELLLQHHDLTIEVSVLLILPLNLLLLTLKSHLKGLNLLLEWVQHGQLLSQLAILTL